MPFSASEFIYILIPPKSAFFDEKNGDREKGLFEKCSSRGVDLLDQITFFGDGSLTTSKFLTVNSEKICIFYVFVLAKRQLYNDYPGDIFAK